MGSVYVVVIDQTLKRNPERRVANSAKKVAISKKHLFCALICTHEYSCVLICIDV